MLDVDDLALARTGIPSREILGVYSESLLTHLILDG
jgi:hypothetical protein